MLKLLHANFARLVKNKVFWGELLCLLVLQILICVTNYIDMQRYDYILSLDELAFNFMQVQGILIAVFCSLYVGTEFSDGVIRNKIMIGHSRLHIFLSNFITCCVVSILHYVFSVIVVCAIGTPLFGFFKMPVTTFMQMLLLGLLLCISFSALFNLIAMLTNKTHSAIIGLLLIFAMLMLTSYLSSTLSAPPVYENQPVFDSTGSIVGVENIVNTNYVSGIKRHIYQFLIDFLPVGQSITISVGAVENPLQMGIYSVILAVVSTLAGILIFNRKNLK